MDRTVIETFHFKPTELNYPWLANFIRCWLMQLRGYSGRDYDDVTFGNFEGFVDTVQTIENGFKEFAEDRFTLGGPSEFAKGRLRLFAEYFTSLWRH